MNGSIASNDNHTLSPKQATKLLEEIDGKTSKCKVNVESKANEFLKKVSLVWADENAVNFAKDIAKKAGQIIMSLSNETQTIKDKIYDIASKYAVAGGMGSAGQITMKHLTFTAAVNPGIVKNTFDGDRYGFADNGSVKKIYEDLETLRKDLQHCGDELINDMRSTNAFGNVSVKNELIVFAGKVNENITSEVYGLTSLADMNLEQAKRRYANVSNAVGGSNFSGGSNGNGSVVSSNLTGSIAGQATAAGVLAGSVASTAVSSTLGISGGTNGESGFASDAFDTYGPITDSDFQSTSAPGPIAQYASDVNDLVHTLADDPALVGEAALHTTVDAVKTAGGFVKSVATDPLSIIDDYKVGVGVAAKNAAAVGAEVTSYIDKGMDVIKGE